MRSTYGAVAGSTLEDWPIGYSDLEPFYEKAEWEMGVSGDDTGNIFKAPRRKSAAHAPAAAGQRTRDSRTGRPPVGAAPVPYSDAAEFRARTTDARSCMRCRWCVGFACELNARTGTHNTVIPTALATGNCELRTECMTREILLDSAGKATGVAYYDADNRLQQQTADLVIVSAGAVESARLLLNTRHRLFPTGLGNRSDWVGRNLQGHSYSGANGLFDFDTFDDIGPGASIAICDYSHGNPGLAGGGMLANEFIRLPIHYVTSLPPWVPRWGIEQKEFIRQYYKRTVVIVGPVQEMPVFDSRVQVDPKVKDAWGIPGGASFRRPSRPHPRNRQVSRREGGGVVAGSGRGADLDACSRAGPQRWPASGRYLPHGERRQNVGRQSRLPAPRCGQYLRDRCQRTRYQWRIQSGAHDPGERLSRFCESAEFLEGIEGAFVRKVRS